MPPRSGSWSGPGFGAKGSRANTCASTGSGRITCCMGVCGTMGEVARTAEANGRIGHDEEANEAVVPAQASRRRGPITTVLSMAYKPCNIGSSRRMGPRLRGDDSNKGCALGALPQPLVEPWGCHGCPAIKHRGRGYSVDSMSMVLPRERSWTVAAVTLLLAVGITGCSSVGSTDWFPSIPGFSGVVTTSADRSAMAAAQPAAPSLDDNCPSADIR